MPKPQQRTTSEGSQNNGTTSDKKSPTATTGTTTPSYRALQKSDVNPFSTVLIPKGFEELLDAADTLPPVQLKTGRKNSC